MNWFRWVGIIIAVALCLADYPLASINVAVVVAIFQLEAIFNRLEKRHGG